MLDREPKPTMESVKPETIEAVSAVVNAKLDNPEIVRADKDRGIFVLDDSGEHGRRLGPRVEVFRFNTGILMRFVENFDETTPRHKPSVLVYDYEIVQGTMKLLIEPIDPDKDCGPLAKARHDQLKLEGIKNAPSEDSDVLSYIPYESHAQSVLTSLKEMKTFI